MYHISSLSWVVSITSMLSVPNVPGTCMILDMRLRCVYVHVYERRRWSNEISCQNQMADSSHFYNIALTTLMLIFGKGKIDFSRELCVRVLTYGFLLIECSSSCTSEPECILTFCALLLWQNWIRCKDNVDLNCAINCEAPSKMGHICVLLHKWNCTKAKQDFKWTSRQWQCISTVIL